MLLLLFIYLFIAQIFTKHCVRPWEYSINKTGTFPTLVEIIDIGVSYLNLVPFEK